MPASSTEGAEDAWPKTGDPPPACVWCGRPFGPGSTSLPGRRACGNCGAATTDPWPSDAQLEAAYSWYRPDSGRFSGIGDHVLRRTRSRLADLVERVAPPGRVLDVGAGDGTLLDAMRARGREGIGLERESVREDIRAGEVADIDGEWAAVIFWHSLEHLRAPGASVDHAAGLLAPGGRLMVAAPNTGSFQAHVFGDRWLHLDLPRHLVHLSAANLTERFRERGLEISRVSHWRGGQILFGWLHGLVGLLPGRPNLYDAIRRPEARSAPISPPRRAAILATAAVLSPLAALASGVEILARRGGTVYVEARRPQS